MELFNRDGKFFVDSREVAEMTGVRHADLLEKIVNYVNHLLNGKFRSVDFFMESSYQDSTGRALPCYLLSRKGCDMVANKMTGEKGVLFTAEYVTRFEEMEKQQSLPAMSGPELIAAIATQAVEQERRLKAVEQRHDRITEVLSLNPTEWRRKVNALINKMGAKLGGGPDAYQAIRNESYDLLEERARCKLAVRVTNIQKTMALEGVAKSKRDKVGRMDAVAQDARLTEIYLAIVKEMAIRYNVILEDRSHGYKETAAVGATVERCCQLNCNEIGSLALDDGQMICETCAQVQSELAP